MSHESISALLDGEFTPEELDRLLEEMERSPALKHAYSRQCMIREAEAGTRIVKDQACICAGVMAGLDEAPGDSHPAVREFAPPKVKPAFAWRPLAGLAAAAAFGAVAVLVALPQQGGIDPAGNAPGGMIPNATNVSLPLPGVRRDRNLRAVVASSEPEQDELREYMMDHSYALEDNGMSGTLSSARFAAHTAEFHPDQAGDPR